MNITPCYLQCRVATIHAKSMSYYIICFRYINGEFYIVTGSKNVHMLIRNKDDIKKYEGDRYRVASVSITCDLSLFCIFGYPLAKFLLIFTDHSDYTDTFLYL